MKPTNFLSFSVVSAVRDCLLILFSYIKDTKHSILYSILYNFKSNYNTDIQIHYEKYVAPFCHTQSTKPNNNLHHPPPPKVFVFLIRENETNVVFAITAFPMCF